MFIVLQILLLHSLHGLQLDHTGRVETSSFCYFANTFIVFYLYDLHPYSLASKTKKIWPRNQFLLNDCVVNANYFKYYM